MSGLQLTGPRVTQTLFWITVQCYFSSEKTVDCKLHFLSCIDIFNAFRISENVCWSIRIASQSKSWTFRRRFPLMIIKFL